MKKMDSDEKLLYNTSPPLTLTEITNLKPLLSHYICKIIINEVMGSGFFCKINDILSMITNNHILDEDKIKTGNKITIEVNDSRKELKLDGKRKAYTNKSIDITVIEIKENDDDLHSFFEIDEDYKPKDLCDILILQFPGGKEASVSYGKIEQIHDLLMFYSASTLPGSSGGAILNRKNYKVIGLHKGSGKNYNKGIFIKRGIDSIFNCNNIYNFNNNYNCNHEYVAESKWIAFCQNCRKTFLHMSYYRCKICDYSICVECYRTRAKIEWEDLNHPHPLERKTTYWFICDNCKQNWTPFYMDEYSGYYCSTCDKYFCWVCYDNFKGKNN